MMLLHFPILYHDTQEGMVSHLPHLQKESMILGELVYMNLNLVGHMFQQGRFHM
jgi:hypothetical protein